MVQRKGSSNFVLQTGSGYALAILCLSSKITQIKHYYVIISGDVQFLDEFMTDCASSHIPQLKSIENGIYVIFIGVNDLASSLLWNGSLAQVGRKQVAYEMVGNISKAIQVIGNKLNPAQQYFLV